MGPSDIVTTPGCLARARHAGGLHGVMTSRRCGGWGRGRGILGASVTARLARGPALPGDAARPGPAGARATQPVGASPGSTRTTRAQGPITTLNHAGMRAWAELAPQPRRDRAWVPAVRPRPKLGPCPAPNSKPAVPTPHRIGAIRPRLIDVGPEGRRRSSRPLRRSPPGQHGPRSSLTRAYILGPKPLDRPPGRRTRGKAAAGRTCVPGEPRPGVTGLGHQPGLPRPGSATAGRPPRWEADRGWSAAPAAGPPDPGPRCRSFPGGPARLGRPPGLRGPASGPRSPPPGPVRLVHTPDLALAPAPRQPAAPGGRGPAGRPAVDPAHARTTSLRRWGR